MRVPEQTASTVTLATSLSLSLSTSASPTVPCRTSELVFARTSRGLFFFSSRRRHTRSVSAFLLNRSSDLTKSNQIKQLIRNGRSASLQRTFKKSFTSFSHSTRNKTRDGLIRVRNIRALNGRFNTSITHAYSIVIGSKHITLNATGG